MLYASDTHKKRAPQCVCVCVSGGLTCPARLKAGLSHLVLQLLVLRCDGLADGNKASHGHVHRLAHPVYGCQGAL